MSFFPKTLKRETTNFICRHLDSYPPQLFQDLPNNVKTMLLEQILRMKTHSHLLKSQQCSRICQCTYCKNVDTSKSTLHLKQLMTYLINPEVQRLIWSLEDLNFDLSMLAKCKKLRSLQLYFDKNVLKGLEFPASRNLHLYLSSVSVQSNLSALFPKFPHLMELKLSNVDHHTAALVTDEVLITLCKSCPLLFSLCLESCNRLTDECLKPISQLHHMNYLNLSKTNITDVAFLMIPDTSLLFQSLTELKLQDCMFLTNALVKCFLIKCPNLTLLNCLGCPRLNNFDLLFTNNSKLQIYFTFDF